MAKMQAETLVRAIIASKFKNTAVAPEDLFQEGMLAILKAEKTFDPSKGVKFETYASRVVQNRLIDILRKEPPEASDSFPDPAGPTPDDTIGEMLTVLRQTLAKCEPLERNIFLSYFQGFSYDEICAKLAVSPKKVDNTIQKIKKRVKQSYGN